MAANPGQDQNAKWKAALAARHKAQRRQRYRPRAPGAQAVTGPGMVRLSASGQAQAAVLQAGALRVLHAGKQNSDHPGPPVCPTGHAYCDQRRNQEGAAMNAITSEPGVVELDREEGRRMLDERTRRELGMSLVEFEAAYDAGTLDLERDAVIGLIMLLPFAR